MNQHVLPSFENRAVKLSREDTCAVVTTYYPDNDLQKRLDLLIPQVGRILIVDNTPGEACPAVISNVLPTRRYEVLRSGENVGVAAALNRAAELCIRDGFKWMLALDQDSTPLPQLWKSLCQAWVKFEPKPSLAIIGASHHKQEHLEVIRNGYAVSPTVITSGSLFRLDVLHKLGGFAEELFIDSVDHEFCLRARARGYTIIEAADQGLHHEIGLPRQFRLLWKRPFVTNHSPLRRYYITRNRLMVIHTYASYEPLWCAAMVRFTIKEFVRMLFFETHRMRKIYAASLGVWHFATGRLGKLEDSTLVPIPERQPRSAEG